VTVRDRAWLVFDRVVAGLIVMLIYRWFLQ
jgi:hypothetical protein